MEGHLDPNIPGRWVASTSDLSVPSGGFVGPMQPSATIHRYPAELGRPPYEKQMLFEVKQARHLGRRATVGESEMKDGTVAAAALYLPPDALNSTMQVDWSSEEMGLIAGAAMEAFANAGGNTPTAENIMEKLGAVVPAGFGAGATLMATRFAERLLGALDTQGGATGKSVLQQMFGQKVDPRTDMIFQAARFRTHTFNFTLIPRNQHEGESINNILNMFQFYMLPKYGGSKERVNLDSFFIGFPYEFDITMITSPSAARVGSKMHSPHINKIDRSVLTQCQINHAAGDKVAFVGRYYPASTTMSLNFTEVRLQGRDSYSETMHRGRGNANLYDPNDVIGTDEMKGMMESGGRMVKNWFSGADEDSDDFVGPPRPK